MEKNKKNAPGTLRPALRWFAGELEMELKKHDSIKGKAGWLGNDLNYHVMKILGHTIELQTVVSVQGAMKHCIHGANHFMMLADNLRAQLKKGRVELNAKKSDKLD